VETRIQVQNKDEMTSGVEGSMWGTVLRMWGRWGNKLVNDLRGFLAIASDAEGAIRGICY